MDREREEAFLSERQITHDSTPHDLDNNINFSPDGARLVFDCRDAQGIHGNTHLGIVDVQTGEVAYFPTHAPPLPGVGAASFLNDRELVAIHALMTGLPYDFTVRGGRILSMDGSGAGRWLDSRNVLPPFTPGALRGGTHKHEPDMTGEWIGFTYNDHIMKFQNGSDLRNVGVSRRGSIVQTPEDAGGQNFVGESFSVLLTACVERPAPGSEEIQRAEGDCWVGQNGYRKADGTRQRARAFRGLVAITESGSLVFVSEVFVVDVPDDLTVPGSLGPLEGTTTDYPKPPRGANLRRLTYTAQARSPFLRGVSGHLRAGGDGDWVAYVGKTEHAGNVEKQAFAVSTMTGETRQLSHLPDGVTDFLRFSPDSSYVAAAAADGSVLRISAEEKTWGETIRLTLPHPCPAANLVISPDSGLVAYNREIAGILQVFAAT